ncbi:carbohydrate sulfotransferase 15-like [Babylonia areolata]|uniref:carbohydrate sulfotransferase 15-like n=1 Tax=Babylonia areolata TaxID=304850 RepID=UPI003FD4DEA0
MFMILLGVMLGTAVYFIALQVGSYHFSTLSLAPVPQRVKTKSMEQQQQQQGQGQLEQQGFPKWWVDSWSRSATSGQLTKFVADRPMFPPCRETPPRREMVTFVERPKYLKNSKNPCWYADTKAGIKRLKCVPYFYLAGVAKAGTTDLARRLRLHPEIFHGTEKEYHWWEKYRFGDYMPQQPADSVEKKKGPREMTFNEYLDKITGREIMKLHTELRRGSSSRVFGDFSPSYLWDPGNWPRLDGNHGCIEPRVIVAQHIRHLYPGARVILSLRHPTSRLYSSFLSRVSRSPELKGSSSSVTEVFHSHVLQGVQSYKRCFRAWSVRHCAYNNTLFTETPVGLVEGMYAVFMADWLKVWPRHQVHVMRYEDYGGHEKERIAEVVNFLGLSPLNATSMERLLGFQPVNTGAAGYKKYGNMLDKTKKILDDFYQPFIDQLADMLGDERFRWKDVAH